MPSVLDAGSNLKWDTRRRCRNHITRTTQYFSRSLLSFAPGNLEPLELNLQLGILLLQHLHPQFQILHLLGRTDAQLLDDLDKTPETQDDNQRRHFLENTVRQDVNEKARNDDESVEDVKPRVEVSYQRRQHTEQTLFLGKYSLKAERPCTQQQLNQEQAREDKASVLQTVSRLTDPRLVLPARIAGNQPDKDVREQARDVQSHQSENGVMLVLGQEKLLCLLTALGVFAGCIRSRRSKRLYAVILSVFQEWPRRTVAALIVCHCCLCNRGLTIKRLAGEVESGVAKSTLSWVKFDAKTIADSVKTKECELSKILFILAAPAKSGQLHDRKVDAYLERIRFPAGAMIHPADN